MKIKKYLLHIGLFIAVAISLIFSAIIWIDPATFHRTTQTTTTTNAANSETEGDEHYSYADVYLPTTVVLTQDKQQMQLTDNNDDIVNDMKSHLNNAHVKSISEKTTKNFNDYHDKFLEGNNIMLSYSAPVSIGVFGKLIDNKVLQKKYADHTFKHIVLPMNDHKTVYLYNDSNLHIYKVKLKKALPKAIYNVIDNKDIQKTPIQYQEINDNHYIRNYTKGVTVPQYSYLINKENTSLFVTHLLGSSNSGSIATNERNGVTTYSTENDQRLIVNNKTGTVNYSRDGRNDYHDGIPKSLNEILKQSFTNLNRLGVALDDVRYQDYNSSNHTITYETYVGGYPIISDNYYGAYEISMQKNGGLQYAFSMDNLQVPLPNNNKTVMLPPTNQVIQNLKNNNYDLNKVEKIEVGYAWSQNPTSQMVIDLTPTYFIYYDGKWMNYSDLNG